MFQLKKLQCLSQTVTVHLKDGAYYTVNIKVFAPDYDKGEMVNLSKGYWNPQRKMEVATHFFEIISLT